MSIYAGLDVSQEKTAICLIDEEGKRIKEAVVASCPVTIAEWPSVQASGLVRAGMETGPLAVWLWNGLQAKGVPIVCMDARHANAALKMMPNKTDRLDAAGLAHAAVSQAARPRTPLRPLCRSNAIVRAAEPTAERTPGPSWNANLSLVLDGGE